MEALGCAPARPCGVWARTLAPRDPCGREGRSRAHAHRPACVGSGRSRRRRRERTLGGGGRAPAGANRLLASIHVTELVHLSVLDQSPVAEGSTGSQALHNTIDLARLADGLGYHRYWVAEHHGGPSPARPRPPGLVGPTAP